MIVFIFLAKVIVCSAAFFGYYYFFLRNKRFHQYNRYYLLIGAVLSLLLPIVQIPVLLSNEVSENVLVKTLSVFTVSGWENEFVVTPHRNVLSVFLTFKNVVWVLYLSGVVILAAYVVKFMLYMRKLSRTYSAEQIDHVMFYNTREPGTPFSFFNAVFWNEKIPVSSEKGRQILQHELFHIHAGHSYDIVFMKVITIFFWFNPFYYLFMKEIKAIHEFLADEHASSTAGRYDYAELLVTEAINNKKAFLSNPFFHNQIKRRITMLIKQNNPSFSYVRKIMALPLLLILFCVFALKCNKKQSDTVNEFNNVSKTKNATLPATEFVSIMKKEELVELTADKQNDVITGTLKNGDTVRTRWSEVMKLLKPDAGQTSVTEPIFTKLEYEAAYPGGAGAWMRYLNKTFRYPQEAQDKGIQGTVVVQFMVDKEGNVSDIKALSGPETGGLKEETMRIIQNSGKWVPGKQNGQAVNSYKKQPVTYKLEEE